MRIKLTTTVTKRAKPRKLSKATKRPRTIKRG